MQNNWTTQHFDFFSLLKKIHLLLRQVVQSGSSEGLTSLASKMTESQTRPNWEAEWGRETNAHTSRFKFQRRATRSFPQTIPVAVHQCALDLHLGHHMADHHQGIHIRAVWNSCVLCGGFSCKSIQMGFQGSHLLKQRGWMSFFFHKDIRVLFFSCLHSAHCCTWSTWCLFWRSNQRTERVWNRHNGLGVKSCEWFYQLRNQESNGMWFLKLMADCI